MTSDQKTQPASRSIRVKATGDSMAEIEMSALDKAREFFGAGWRLRIEPAWEAFEIVGDRLPSGGGEKFYAYVVVSLVEPEQ